MKLTLQKVRFWNFMSFGNTITEIDLNTHPTTLIVGKNGSGKSSAILDSISFALFNKPFRNIRKPQLTNSVNSKNLLVEVDFTINSHQYMVRRGIKPTVFEIYKNGNLITQAADSRDYQEDFERTILKVNHKTFCQIVMLGSAIFTPFMALKTDQRRDIIEDLLDLKIFSTMNTILKDKASVVEKSLTKIKTEKNLLESKISLTQKYIKESIQSNDDLVNEKQEKINEIEFDRQSHSIEIVTLQKMMEPLVASLSNVEILNKKFQDLTNLQYQMQHKEKGLSQEVSFLVDNENCPTCKQVIDPKFKNETVASKTDVINEINEGMKKIAAKKAEVQTYLNEVTRIQREIQNLNNQIGDHRSHMRALDTNIRHLEEDIKKLTQAKEKIDLSELETMANDLEANHKVLVELEDDKTVMSFAANMLKDTGIKSQIIKTYIPVINNLIAKYLAALDFFVSFELDENFNETIKSRFRDEFSYMSFSEGEKCRLNIAILFAWRAIAKMRGSIDCNLVVLDELFDSSLDVTGVDDMMKLLNNLTNGENVFIISHREDQISDKFSRVLRFEKHNNFSQLGVA